MPLEVASPAGLRVAVISLHTSPLDTPGVGDAGGMNVYVSRVARALAAGGASVDVFTRARSAAEVGPVRVAPGVTVHGLEAGPLAAVSKSDLPGLVSPFTAELLRHEAAVAAAPYDVVHSHYWLSGQAGAVAAGRWRVPLVHTMHTMAAVKNAALAGGDRPEPVLRVLAEEDLIARSDALIANTFDEAGDLIRHGARSQDVHVVWPGVDLQNFRPGSRSAARRALGIAPDRNLLLFVGRIQPLKAPEQLIRMAAEIVRMRPGMRANMSVVICGGRSGPTGCGPDDLAALAGELGVSDLVRLEPPTDPGTLADWYRAADLTVMPSFSESFGLVALESQAAGTPVLAADVGGLRTSVGDGDGGVLVAGRDVSAWAVAALQLLDEPGRLSEMGAAAVSHARNFGWETTARDTVAVYRAAIDGSRRSTARRTASIGE